MNEKLHVKSPYDIRTTPIQLHSVAPRHTPPLTRTTHPTQQQKMNGTFWSNAEAELSEFGLYYRLPSVRSISNRCKFRYVKSTSMHNALSGWPDAIIMSPVVRNPMFVQMMPLIVYLDEFDLFSLPLPCWPHSQLSVKSCCYRGRGGPVVDEWGGVTAVLMHEGGRR